MPPAANLQEAAGLAYDNLYTKWALGYLQYFPALLSFVQALASNPNLFPESAPNNHPIANWLAVISAYSVDLTPNTLPALVQLNEGAQLIYRICWCADALRTANLITAPQAAAVLTQYNASFA